MRVEFSLCSDEEEYFGEGDDDEEPPPQQAGSRHSNGVIEGLQMNFPLVDYADDEDDTNPGSPGVLQSLMIRFAPSPLNIIRQAA